MRNGHWTAAHVYRATPDRTFLLEAVKPLVQSVRVRRFFFTRVPERGPHLRLRFHVRNAAAEPELREAVTAHFAAYFRKKPSRRNEERPDWYPNDSVQFLPYEPDVMRLGGTTGVTVAEEQFAASSRAALAAFASTAKWTAADAFRSAVAMHTGFALGLGMPPAAAARFYGALAVDWIGCHPEFNTTDDNSAELFDNFERRFDEERGAVVPFVTSIWHGLSEGECAPWLLEWVESMRRIRPRLRTFPATRAVLGGYIHMTNNRLAVTKVDEPYIAYLLRRSFETL